MDKNKKLELKVGIVTILALVLFVVGMSLGKGFTLPSNEQFLKIKFPNSGGITEGSPVVVDGVRRGAVRNVKNVEGGVLVVCALDNYDDLKADASAKITILEITGGKKIEIMPGISQDKFSLNNYLIGRTPADIAELVAVLGDFSDELIVTVRRLDTIAASVNTLLADKTLLTDLKTSMQNLASLTENADNLISSNYTNINKSLNNLSVLSEDLKNAVKKHEPSLDVLLKDLKIAVTNTKELLSKADLMIGNANNLVQNVDGVVTDVKNQNGLVGKMIYDKQFANKLDSAFVELFNLVNMIKEHGVNVNVRLGSRP